MKYILLIWSFCCIMSTNAQRPGGGNFSRSGQVGAPLQGDRPERPKFDAYKASGIIYYDTDEVIKRLKIKKDDVLRKKIEVVLLKFNHSLEEIGLVNKENLDTLNVYMNYKLRPAFGVGEERDMQSTRMAVREKIRPVRRSVRQEEYKLNEQMSEVLDEKQFKRWKNYLIELKESINPRRNKENEPNRMNPANPQRNFNQQGNQGQGFGGGRQR